MAIHIGRVRAGTAGLIVAGACFILPAMLIVLACAWAYVRFGKLPQLQGVLYGVKPVIIAIVAQALWGLGKSALKTKLLAALAIAAAAAAFIGAHELLILFIAGLIVPIGRRLQPKDGKLLALPLPMLGAAAATATSPVAFNLLGLFLFFLKTGSVLFGSGYVLLAFMRADLVDRWGWLTEAQLLDAIAVGQVTPGPVFTSATFIGYVLGGFPGAVIATVGIFLPAFVFVAISAPFIPRLRSSPVASGFLDGVNVASLALMAVVTWHLARGSLVDPWTGLLCAASLAALLTNKVSSTWLIAAGAAMGLLITFL